MMLHSMLNGKIKKLYCALKKRQALWISDVVKKRRGIKVTARLIPNFPGVWENIIEQTPNGSCQWGSTLFLGPDGSRQWGRALNHGKDDADLYIVLNTSTHDFGGQALPNVNLPSADKVWGLHTEPPEYVDLFNLVEEEEHQRISRFYTTVESLYTENPTKYIPSPPYVVMYIDQSWDFLARAAVPSKTEDLCMISSSLKTISGHRERVKFIDELANSSLDFSLWGRGEDFNKYSKYRGFAPNKWDVLSPCKYSIVIENSVVPFYWTEKISDSLLAFTLPLYYGSPNVNKFLPEDCYIPIDIHDPHCIEKIQKIIDTGEYEKRLPSIIKAREKVLYEQNLFAFLDREINKVYVNHRF
jgi:Glycosyltransferase family 10 (fucosyltransferase) C-term